MKETLALFSSLKGKTQQMRLINTNRWNRIRYALYAPFYDLTVRAFTTTRSRSIALLGLKPGESVLLVGAGTGIDLPAIPEQIQITAVDITLKMVDRIRQRAELLGRTVHTAVMDGQALDLPNEQFDAVILHLILAVIPDPIACIKEAIRVLKPGGRIVIFDKFLQKNQRPSLVRQLANGVTSVLFSTLNRRLEVILDSQPLQIVHEEAAHSLQRLGYRIVLLKKTLEQD